MHSKIQCRKIESYNIENLCNSKTFNCKQCYLYMKNIFGEKLECCCTNPLTGFYRDGFCRTDASDVGTHVICAIVTKAFLEFSLSKGNDLITPKPQYNFPGLKPGDKWCLCALRWKEAFEAGVAPMVVLQATAEEVLNYIDINHLISHAYKHESI
jgi:uncharacterized protein